MAVLSTGRVSNAFLLLLGIGSANAFWRLECQGNVGLARMDPLVDFGKAASHVHSIKGGSGFSTTATSADLMKSKCASCSVGQDKSAYWTPAVYFMHDDGTYEVVPEKPPHKTYYFLNGGMTHDGKEQKIEAFPNGFQMIAGSNYNRNCSIPDPDPNPLGPWPDLDQGGRTERAIGFNCLNYAGGHDEPSLFRHVMPEKSYLDSNCADGIRLELMFPSCWNGELDSKDHKSHVAFPDSVMTGNCPEGYDRRLPSLFYETIIATDSYKGKSGKFVFSNGDIQGFGYHGDFIAAWDEGVLQKAVDTCTSLSGDQKACEIFEFPAENGGDCTLQDPLPEAIAGENVKGPMKGLPNKIAIQTGPEPATKAGGSQPVATVPTSVAPEASTSVAKNPVISLSSSAAKAEASHTVPTLQGGMPAQETTSSSSSSSASSSSISMPVQNYVAERPASPTTTSSSMTTPAPEAGKPGESTVDVSYTTIGREVHEQIDVMVEVTVTATSTETAHVAKRSPHAHHKHHIHHHKANARGIGGRRLR